MSFDDGFSVKPIPFVQPLPGTASVLVSSPDGTGWIASGVVDEAISASVYVIETIETAGNIDGNGAPEDPVVLKNNISLTSVTASFNGDGNKVTNITASNIANFERDVKTLISGSQYVTYNNSSGVIALPYTGTILGTTPLVLGTTVNSLTGLTNISSSAFIGNGSQITDITASHITNFTNDVRAQITSGNGVSIVDGVVTANVAQVVAGTNMVVQNNAGTVTASLSASVTGLNNLQTSNLTASSAFISGDIRINGTASIAQVNTLNQTSLVVGDKYITILSGGTDHASLDGSGILWGSGGVGPTVDELGANAHVRFNNSLDLLEIFPGVYSPGLVTGSTAKFSSVTASFSGDGNNITNLTSSHIVNFTKDVRLQLTGSEYVTYNTSSGQISLPFTGTILGTTGLILGQTTTVLNGISSLSASNLNVSSNFSASSIQGNIISGSFISASYMTAGNYSFANASSSSDPAVLDDYREGSWTPLLTCTGATFTTGSAAENVGKYTKIGNIVMINGNISITAKTGLASNNTTQVFVSGLPYTSSNAISCSAYVGYYQGFNTNFPTLGVLPPAETKISFFAAKNASGAEIIRYTDLNPSSGTPTKITFNLMYYVV